MQKKILFLLASLGYLLAACGGGDNPSSLLYRLTKIERVFSLGTVDLQTVSYTSAGQVVNIQIDLSSDQTINYISTYEYSGNGRLDAEYVDDNGDSENDIVYYYKYDPNGQLSQVNRDDYLDDHIDSTEHYYYGESNRISRIENKNDADQIVKIKYYYYDENGYVNKIDTEINSAGTENFKNIIENGRLIRTDSLGLNDIVNYSYHYTYEQGACALLEPKSLQSYICSN